MNDFSWLGSLLQTTDSFYPSGGFSHSMGLEALVQAGVVTDRASLERYLAESFVPALVHADLVFLGAAWKAAETEDVARVRELGMLCHATRGSRELREASLGMGRQRLAMAAELTADPLLRELQTETDFLPHLPVVQGAEASVRGVPVDAASCAAWYQGVAGQVSAAMKLIRLGPAAAQAVLSALLERASDGVAQARSLDVEEAGWFSPRLDIASAQHESAFSRLFVS